MFVSYRRGDAQWFAGRLTDSLASYFGDKRVFRDIEGIAGGADFGAVIQQTLTSSDAVIVVIGKGWLNAADDQGARRLDKADDWVVQEVGAALAKGVPVFPVLVEDTPMPRAEELPQALRSLARYNAISISDSRWEGDTDRLAKIISLDIPSATERRLRQINVAISTLLVLAMVFEASVLFWQLLNVWSSGAGPQPASIWDLLGKSKELCDKPDGHSLRQLLTPAQSGAIFLVMVPSSALMFALGRHVDASSRTAYYAAAWLGALGSLATFILYYPVCKEFEPIVNFYLGMVLAPAMLALMSVSGFRSK